MEATQPLRDVFAGLAGTGGAGEPAAVLAASGHEDLPDGLVAEAVVNYADTAPVEVAEHLASFVRAHSPVPGPAGDPPTWVAALGSAPVDIDPAELDPVGHDVAGAGPATRVRGGRAGTGDVVPDGDGDTASA